MLVEIKTGTGGIPSIVQKTRGRKTLSPKIRDFVQTIKVTSEADDKWSFIDVPYTRYEPTRATYIKAVINYRRLRDDYHLTKIKTITCKEDAPKGYFRIWVKIYPK